MKKIFIPLLLLIIIGGSTLLYWYVLRGMLQDYPEAAKAIPEDAYLVYKGEKFRKTYETFKKTPLAQGLKALPAFDTLNQTYKQLDSFITGSQTLGKFINQHPLHLSLHNVSVDEINLLGLLQTESLNTASQFQSFIQKNCRNCRFQKRQMRGFVIVDVKQPSTQKPLLTYTVMDGILVISPNAVLVEDAVRQFGKTKAGKDQVNAPLEALAQSQKTEQLLVNFEALPQFLGTFTNYKSRDFLDRHGLLPGYAIYEILLQQEYLQLHGTYRGKEKGPLLELVQQQSPKASQIPKVLPFRTAFFQSFRMPDPQAYLRALREHASKNDQQLAFNHYKDSLENELDFSIQDDFLPILGDELALAVNEPVSQSFKQNVFLTMHAEDAKTKLKQLKALKAKAEADKHSTTSPIEYRGRRINRLPLGGIFPFLFGEFFNTIRSPFFTRIGDFILFGKAPETLKRVIDDYEAGQTLASSSHFTRLQEHLVSEDHIAFYLNPDRAIMLPLNYLKSSLKGPYRQNFNFYKQYGGLVFQLVKEEPHFFSQVTLQKASESSVSNTALIWEQKIDTSLTQPPQIVINHENEKKEIFLADADRKIHLMNNSGSILWTKSFKEPVMGTVDQVDLYENDNLQYVFATQNNLQLVDRKGRDVASFPISLSAPASTELVSYDYEGSKDYRYFIGCKNRKVYGYYANGNPLGGWSPKKLKASLDHPIKYFQYKGRTYLFGVTQQGHFYLWQKDGEREFMKDFNTRFSANFEMHFGDTDSTTYLAAPDTAGKMRFVNLNGDTSTLHLGNFKGDYHFDFKDFNQDDRQEFIFSQGTTLKAFQRDSAKAYSLTLADSIAYAPQFHKIDGKPYVGYTSANTGQIFLVDLEGTFYPGFPLKGSTPFKINDINKDGELELVVAGKDGRIYLYKLK